MRDLFTRYGGPLAAGFMALTAFWLLALVILPYLYLFENSFRPYLPVVEMGGPKDFYSLNNYLTFFQSPIHIHVFFSTILYSSLVTVLCFFIAYPLAYYLSKVAKPSVVPTLFLLLLIPLWVSEILRSFAWFIILAFKGPLNFGLLGLGIIDAPIRWLSGFRSIVIGLVYTYVLFMLFPLYNAVQSLDTNQIEAAQDLGSPWWRIHWRVILPHSSPESPRGGHGFHASRQAPSSCRPSGLDHLAAGLRDHPAMDGRIAALEHRLRLCLPAASPLHGFRHRGDADLPRQPRRYCEVIRP